jgi:hypothetical protein
MWEADSRAERAANKITSALLVPGSGGIGAENLNLSIPVADLRFALPRSRRQPIAFINKEK